MEKTVRIAGLNTNDFTNGIGVTVSLFLQGCPHHCNGCHSPGTWDPFGGREIEQKKLTTNIINAIKANGIVRNLAISGGEPLADYNIDYTKNLIKEVQKVYPDIDIFIWTGYTLQKIEKKLKGYSNLYIIAEPFILEQRNITLCLRGSNNQKIFYVTKDFFIDETDIFDKK